MIIKKIVGWLLAFHIIPGVSLLLVAVNGEIGIYGYIVPIVAGYIMNVIIISFIALIALIFWLISD